MNWRRASLLAQMIVTTSLVGTVRIVHSIATVALSHRVEAYDAHQINPSEQIDTRRVSARSIRTTRHYEYEVAAALPVTLDSPAYSMYCERGDTSDSSYISVCTSSSAVHLRPEQCRSEDDCVPREGNQIYHETRRYWQCRTWTPTAPVSCVDVLQAFHTDSCI